MATTKVKKIKETPQRTISYIMKDKVEEYFSENEIITSSPHETWIDEETGKKYVLYYTQSSFLNCDPKNPYAAFYERQTKYQGQRYTGSAKKNKDGLEPVMYHLIQSFKANETDTFTANEIGRKLAEELLGDYICVVSTHGNTDAVHNHIGVSAWDSEGRKLNYDEAFTNSLRAVSDRLCEEYGLSVLDNTRIMKLSSYKDKGGKIHRVEMTDRKKTIIEEREQGFASTDDIGSYRNSDAYKESERSRRTNIKDIRDDIDMLLPTVSSYEDLISQMRKLGYVIKDRKKNGEWLAHISFKAPAHEKATRDSSLSKDGFYERKNLTEYILSLHENDIEREEVVSVSQLRHSDIDDAEELDLPVVEYFESYEYGKTDIEKVNAKYRAVVDKETGEIKTVRRTPFEEKTVTYLKKSYRILDTDRKTYHITPKNRRLTSEERAKLVNRIVQSWNCLTYCEQHNLYSYSQMLKLYESYKADYDKAIESFSTIEQTLIGLNDIKKLSDRAMELEKRMSQNKGNIAYTLRMYPEDMKEYSSCMEQLAKHKLSTAEEREAFFNRIGEIEKQQNDNRAVMAVAIYQMNELENCVHTLSYIDREAGLNTEDIESRFAAIRRNDAEEKGKSNRDISD